MANSLTAASPKFWSKIMGIKLYKSNVFTSLASRKEEATLSLGQKVTRPYRSDVVTEKYVKGTAASAQDLTVTDDELTVDQSFDVLFYVDNIDKIQNRYDIAAEYASESGIRLANDVDAAFLYETINAANTVDDGSLGGTSGNGITLTVSNLIATYGQVNQKLDLQNVPETMRYIVISPQWRNILWQYVEGKFSALGDRTAEFANIGTYAGLAHYVSNNLTAETVVVYAADPSNTNTLTIDGVTFTYVSSIGSTAGNILIGGDPDTTIGSSLVTLINAGGVGDGTNSISLSTANQRKVQKWVASYVASTNTLTVRIKGRGYLTTSLVTIGVAGSITAAKMVQHVMAGQKGSVDIVIQKEPSTEIQSTVSNGKWGKNIMAIVLFGAKTFNQGTNQIVDIKIRTDAF